MSNDLVSETTVDGADIQPIVEKLEVALAEVPRIPALVALTSMILFLQYPSINMDQLYEGVQDISRYVTLWLSTLDEAAAASVPASQLN